MADAAGVLVLVATLKGPKLAPSTRLSSGLVGLPLRGRGQIVLPELEEGFLDVVGGGASDALVDGKGLPQAGGAFAGVAVAEMAVADAFQGPCFLRRDAEVAGDGQRLVVVAAGLAATGGPGR
jgi:hypothetical protein